MKSWPCKLPMYRYLQFITATSFFWSITPPPLVFLLFFVTPAITIYPMYINGASIRRWKTFALLFISFGSILEQRSIDQLISSSGIKGIVDPSPPLSFYLL